MLFDDRLMAVANFGTGKLYPLSYNDPKPQLTEMQLPRLIENPDGMGLAPDGALIVLENAIQSGQGRILRIPSPKAAGMHRIEILREGMESPVNLTIPHKAAPLSANRASATACCPAMKPKCRQLPPLSTAFASHRRAITFPPPLRAAACVVASRRTTITLRCKPALRYASHFYL